MSRRSFIPLAVALALPVATVAGAATISANLAQKASCHIKASADGCSNNPGPYITLDGDLDLGGINARIILTNNAKFTHVASKDIVAEVELVPEGESIKIAKQPSRGGVGGNPWIYLQFKDPRGNCYGSPQLLGRCVQGLSAANLEFNLPTSARCDIRGGECSNNPGPYITLDGELRLGGLCAQLILTNNAKFTHVTSRDVTIDVDLIEDGKCFTFHKQPSQGGAGGNPWIYVQFLSGSGRELGSPILVGRCNQL